MEDYLPELQKAGVAEGVDSPANHFEAINKEQRFVRYGIGVLLAAPLISLYHTRFRLRRKTEHQRRLRRA